jgi:hypothetical protein
MKGNIVEISRNITEFSVLVVDPLNTNAVDVLPSKKVESLCDVYSSSSSSVFGISTNTVSASSMDIVSLVYDEAFSSSSSKVSLTAEVKDQLHSYHSILFERIHNQLRRKNYTSLSIKQKLKEFQSLSSSSKGRFPEYKDRSIVKPPFWQYCNTNHLVDIFERIFSV